MRNNATNHDEGAEAVTTKTPGGRTPTTKAPRSSGSAPQDGDKVPERTSVRSTGTSPSGASATDEPTSSSGASSSGGASSERPASVPPAGGAPRPVTGKAGAGSRPSAVPVGTSSSLPGPRRVRLGVARVDPWSVLKFSFLMSFAIGIIIVVGAAVLWYVLNGLHVFTTINDTIAEIAGDETKINFLDAVTFSRTVSLATIIALVDIVLLTALSTIFAFLYNITSALVGGVTVTLSDE